MGLFNRKQTASAQMSQRQVIENAIRSSRNNLLIVLVFTALNVILLATNSNTYFLFSAYVPYMLVDYGMFFGGMYPPELYGEYLSELVFLGKGFFAAMIALAVVAMGLYALCWFFAKKNPGKWLLFALILICVDTVLLVYLVGISADMIMDYVFHGWIIVSLITGLSAVKKLKELPAEEEEQDALPAEEEWDTPPAKEEWDAPPAKEEWDTPPAKEKWDVPPVEE